MLSLKNTSLVTFAAIVAVPLIMFWAWPRTANVDAALEKAKQSNILLADTIGASLDFYHFEMLRTFERAIEESEANTASGMPSALAFCYIAWADAATGKIIRKLGFRSELVPAQLSADELAELKSTIEIGRTSPGRMHEAPGQPAELRFAHAEHGVIVFANIAAGRIESLVRNVGKTDLAQVTVLDQAGQVIASTERDIEQHVASLTTHETVHQARTGTKSSAVITLPGTSEPVLASASPVASTGWSVVVYQPVSRLVSAADSARPALDLAALCVLIAALIGSIAAAPIVAPLMDVIRAARRMQGGETEVRISALSRFAPTELVELSSAFNAMAESVASARRQEAEARAKAEQASLSKTEFLRNVTHEVRTPLNAIIGFSEVLLNECRRMNLPHRQISHAEDICAAGRHMLSLINSLLDLSRIEAGQYQLQDAPTALDEVISRCVRFLGPAAQARKSQIEMHIAPDLPDVVADERALFQSVLNLTANAVRYGREGGHVIVSAVPSRLHGVEISVSDDGPGIPAEYLDKVMEPFVRVACEANRNVEGSGLGLPIVKKLVELHGGSFVLESTVGAGTTARIRLPASRLLPRTDQGSIGQAAA